MGYFLWVGLLGTHALDYHAFLLVAVALPLVSRQSLFDKASLWWALTLAVVYGTWYRLDPGIVDNFRWWQGGVLYCAYLLGLSIPQTSSCQKEVQKTLLILQLYPVVYLAILAFSLLWVPQPKPLGDWGMWVWFEHEYHRLNVHEGRLISTIIAYVLTPMAAWLPLFAWQLLGRKSSDPWQKGWMVLMFVAALFAFWLGFWMHRRLVVLMPPIAIVILVCVYGWHWLQNKTIRWRRDALFGGIGFVVLLFLGAYWAIEHSTLWAQTFNESIWHDRRFEGWIRGLEVVWHYPWGGGHGVKIFSDTKLAHNTWIDIGKDFGVIAMGMMVLFFVWHLLRGIELLRSRCVGLEQKLFFFLWGISIGAVLMIEPVFTSDKIFVAYVVLCLGALRRIDRLCLQRCGR